jgi:hypothetical protein
MYGPKCHLQVRPGPMDSRASAHLLLHSGVALACLCGASVWRVVDCYRATRGNESEFAQVPYNALYVSLQTYLNLISICGLFCEQDKPEEEQERGGLESSSPGLYCLVGRERVKLIALPPWRTA